MEHYRTSDLEARRRIVGLQPARADIILAGACIVRVVMDKLGRDTLTVSDRGLRHGLLDERFGHAPARTSETGNPAERGVGADANGSLSPASRGRSAAARSLRKTVMRDVS